MRKTIYKWIWIWNFEQEEKWLNEMAAKGLCLISVGFCRYEFEECIPGEYKICMQMLEHGLHNVESEKYLDFVEGTGAQHVGTFKRWVYFRKKAREGAFELFSDNDSRIKYLNRIINFVAAIGLLNIFVGVYNLLIASVQDSCVNLLGMINLLLGILAGMGTYKLWKKKKKLKEEGQLFE